MENRIKIIAIQDNVFQDGQDGKDGRDWGWNGDYKPFMKKGWITWTDYFRPDSFIFIENNKYRINFNPQAFEVYHESPYQRKLREKQERREEVISQSEIKHKVTLVRISI